jgi:radical SAM superfamily enzyme YgiQ (UPF0313 family)
MDLMLIFPPLSVGERYGNKRLGRAIGGNLPPLGIASIAAFLRQSGFNVGIIDGPAGNIGNDGIIEKVRALRPKVVGFSSITPVFHRSVELAKIIKKHFLGILVVIGGHHASILPAEVLRDNPCFDLAVYGEGEITAFELLERFRERDFALSAFLTDYAMLEDIHGIAFRRSGGITLTPRRQHIQDLDMLPDPAWDLLPMERYIPLPNQYLRKPVVHMVTTRGCAFQCSFCSNNAVFGRKLRAISPKRLVGMIRRVKDEFGAREISFWDDSMTTDNKWMFEFCDLVLRKRLDITWTCYSRVDTVSRGLLAAMKKAGCWNIFYGYEAGNQRLLDMINKKVTLEQIRQANQWTKETGIEVRASFMLALPGETPRTAKETIDFAVSLEPDYAQFTLTTPYPKTKLFEETEKHGTLSKDFAQYNIWEPVFVPSGYKDKAEVKAISRMAFRRFYLRPGYLIGRIKKIRTITDILRYLQGLRFILKFVR